MKIQNTRLSKLQDIVSEILTNTLVGPWKRRSLGLLSLLIGFYLGSNLTVYYFQKSGNRILIVLIMVLLVEFCIRIRSKIKFNKTPLPILFVDNLRIGSVYAVVFEAFKLGS